MNLVDNPNCRFCNENTESSDHLLLHCIRTENIRLSYCNLMKEESAIKHSNNKWQWFSDCVSIAKCEYIDYIYNEIKQNLLFDNG